MRIFILVSAFLILFICPIWADEAPLDDTNWGISPSEDYQTVSASEDTWDNQRQNIIEEKYGSDQSPAFLNRARITPYEDGNDGDSDNYQPE